MKRRNFISHATMQLLSLSAASSLLAMGENNKNETFGVLPSGKRAVTKIGKWSLAEIRAVFEKEYKEKIMTYWNEQEEPVVDWKYGGYFAGNPTRHPTPKDAKWLYYQGRILWLYSYFYNYFGHDEFHLRAAKCGYDFLTKYAQDFGPEGYGWADVLSREGKDISMLHDTDASIDMLMGLVEYYHATGIEEARELAVKTANRLIKVMLDPSFQSPEHQGWFEPGVSLMGNWVHYLSALTPLLKYIDDPGVEKIAQFVMRLLLEHHFDPELGIFFESISLRTMKPHPKSYIHENFARVCTSFHSMQASWMCMDESLREENVEMFRKSEHAGKLLMEKCWAERDGKQGLMAIYRPDQSDPFAEPPVLPKYEDTNGIHSDYVNKEVFVFCLLALEHDPDAQWAADWFDKAFTYSYVTDPVKWPYHCTLHNPRGDMFSIQILNRMIERKEKVSDFFEKYS
ncbi:hypothetical protein LLG96_12595 [bacterium]|nr:hypothetical protein [bacterium]